MQWNKNTFPANPKLYLDILKIETIISIKFSVISLKGIFFPAINYFIGILINNQFILTIM